MRQLSKAGCKKVFREAASGAKTDRAQLRRLLDQLEADDVLTVTRLDRLARSSRDLLNTLATITAKKAGFRSLADTWADTTTSHGRARDVKMGRKPKLTPHQRNEALRRRENGEAVRDIARTYNVHSSTISRLTAWRRTTNVQKKRAILSSAGPMQPSHPRAR
jgi:DNA invertase Pin-like site-specific DNA recombinase